MIGNRLIVEKTPILTTLMLESANVAQIWRMLTERTSRGQSVQAWLLVIVALILWANYFRVVTPEQKLALWCTYLGVAMNTAVVLCVVYFRIIGR